VSLTSPQIFLLRNKFVNQSKLLPTLIILKHLNGKKRVCLLVSEQADVPTIGVALLYVDIRVQYGKKKKKKKKRT
jgi:hypothetical protein